MYEVTTEILKKEIVKSPAESHCELCGKKVDGIESDTFHGYTVCCNELTCNGGGCVIVVTTGQSTGHFGTSKWVDKAHYRNAEDAERS